MEFSMRRILTLLLFIAAPLDAQIGRRSFTPAPDYWVGLSYGFIDGTTITDGRTNAVWQFGYSSQIRATFEKSLQRGIAAGVSAGFSTAPLTYSSTAFGTACNSCRANADITQLMAYVHGGSGVGFHGIYDLEAGFTGFSNFRTREGNVTLPPSDGQYDFSFGFGGGLGYGISPTMDAYVAEMFDLVMHPQDNTVQSSAPRLMTFRLGMRVGF
jgi:hypothetical protein